MGVDSPTPLWTPNPKRAAGTQMNEFRNAANRRHSVALRDYRDLHAWSVEARAEFWDLVWDFGGVIGEKGKQLIADGNRMRWQGGEERCGDERDQRRA